MATTTTRRGRRGDGTGVEPERQPERRLISLKAAAQRCGVSQSTVRRWLAQGCRHGFPLPVVQGKPSGPVTDKRGTRKGCAGGHRLQFWEHELDHYLDRLPRYQPPGSGS